MSDRASALEVSDTSLGVRGTLEATAECEGGEKPVCFAEFVVLTVS